VSTLVAIVGPTAVGKTELALELADQLPLEVVNADSRQVYRYMDIGTGKPSREEQRRVPHHVIDVAAPDEVFSLATYGKLASHAFDAIRGRGKLPLLVGGTGQYVWSLLEGWRVPHVPPDPEFRKTSEEVAVRRGSLYLHEELRRIDPVAANRIQATNVRRVIRALEVHRATGELPSRILWKRNNGGYKSLIIGLTMKREMLLARADARIDRMIRQGFADEVRWLLEMGYDETLPAMSSIGYREMIAYVRGQSSLSGAVTMIQRETRRLMRRQRAWFRADDPRIQWLDHGSRDQATSDALRLIQGVAR